MQLSPHFQPAVLAQDAVFAALPSLRIAGADGSISVQNCGDTQDEIASALRSMPHAMLFLQQSSVTEALLEHIEASGIMQPKIVAIAQEIGPVQLEELIGLGCVGVVSSDLTPHQLQRMISAIAAGEMWLPRKWSSFLIHRLVSKQKSPKLSRRECDVLNLLRRKLKNREIASALEISEETLRWHLRHLYAKTKQRSRGDLVTYAQMFSIERREPGDRLADQLWTETAVSSPMSS